MNSWLSVADRDRFSRQADDALQKELCFVLWVTGIGVSFWEGQPRQPQEAPKGAYD